MTTLLFLIREGFAGFKRARVATMITISTITLALCLIGLFAVGTQNLTEEFSRTYQRIRLNVFIDPSLSETQLQSLEKRIAIIQGIATVRYISPEEALQQMQREFDAQLLTTLGENPLPPSLEIQLNNGVSQIESVQTIVRQVESFPEVDEVVYAENVLRILNRYFEVGVTIALLVGGIVFFIAIVLIYNTIRLTIHSRKTIVEIMRLVGATDGFIRAPFLIEGVLQGLIGSVLSGVIIWLIIDAVNQIMGFQLSISPLLLNALGLFLLGCFIGWIGSYLSVSKYLKW